MPLYKWSPTAAANATADPSINWSEGQAPSSVNDSARAMMAAIATARQDTQAVIGAGGTASALTYTSGQGFSSLALMDSQLITFVAPLTNAAGATLNVDSLGAIPICVDAAGTPIPAGVLVGGTPYMVTYYNSISQFRLWNLFANPYNIPLGAGMDYWLPTTPNSSFVFPAGQAISRATYAALYALMGNAYGAGDGSTTFNLPDKTGRVSAMKEASASRLTSTYFGGNSTVLGAAGGAESQTLTLAQTPTGITSTGTASVTTTSTFSDWIRLGSAVLFGNNQGGAGGGISFNPSPTSANVGSSGSGSASVTSTNTSGNAHPIVQPTIVCNYIMRII
jgi:microcystin-dependent protein